ncbi:MAG: ComEC/Rec2 family competence protein [Rhodothalassiaceae bacterium]
MPGAAGSIAAALLTGQRGGIPKPVEADLRTAGLAHLLAISGLHVGLVAAALFFTVRLGLACSEALAVRLPLKAIAAVAAWAGAGGYVLLAGAPIPSQRAFIMVSLSLAALMLGRRPFSLRLVAAAALGILLIRPDALVSAGFQMSFAAAIALTAAYEALSPWLARWRGDAGAGRRIALFFFGVVMSTLIAEIAIAPFAAYHFQRFGLYGPAANLVAVPVMSLWIMPWGLAALMLMPLGMEGLALAPMGWGIELVLATAKTVASWPGAEWPLRAFPAPALLCFAGAGLMLTLSHGRILKLLAPGVALAGLILAARSSPPHLIVDGVEERVGLLAEGRLWTHGRGGRFEIERWQRRLGLPDQRRPGALADAPGVTCDPLGCHILIDDRRIALAFSAEAVAEDCATADMVIAITPVPDGCRAPHRLDRFDFLDGGPHSLNLHSGEIRSTAQARGRRPWVPR